MPKPRREWEFPAALSRFYGFNLDAQLITALQRALNNFWNERTGGNPDHPDCPTCKGVSKVKNGDVEETCLACDGSGRASKDGLLDVITHKVL
jgi:hypothetical protein